MAERNAPPEADLLGCYEKERTWEHVEGTPESWEAAAIFDADDLQRELQMLAEYPPDETAVSDAQAELRSIWTERRSRVDAKMPSIIGRDVAEAAAVAYGLPGWE